MHKIIWCQVNSKMEDGGIPSLSQQEPFIPLLGLNWSHTSSRFQVTYWQVLFSYHFMDGRQ